MRRPHSTANQVKLNTNAQQEAQQHCNAVDQRLQGPPKRGNLRECKRLSYGNGAARKAVR
eukprot:2782512-Prymnesium_polylepis.1